MRRLLLGALLCLPCLCASAGEPYDTHIRDGRSALSAGDLAKAAREFEAAVSSAGTAVPAEYELPTALNNLAYTYVAQGRYAQAMPLYERALTLNRKLYPADDIGFAGLLDNVADNYKVLGRYNDAATLYRQSFQSREKAKGPQAVETAFSLQNLADIERLQGRYERAEAQYQRVLTILERQRGLDHPDLVTTLNNLGLTYDGQGRYTDAAALYSRAFDIAENASGLKSKPALLSAGNLATARYAGKDYDAAARILKRILPAEVELYGPNHPRIAQEYNNLAEVYRSAGKPEDAEPLLKQAIRIHESTEGPEHLGTGSSVYNLSLVYRDLGRFAEAEPLARRAQAIFRKNLGNSHPDLASSLTGLASLRERQGRISEGLTYIREANSIRAARAIVLHDRNIAAVISEQRSYAKAYIQQVQLLAAVSAADPAGANTYAEEAFAAAQRARTSDTAGVVARMAARFSTGNDALARLIRERQDAQARWQALQNLRIAAISADSNERNATEEAEEAQERASVERQFDLLDTRLNNEYPEYGALTSPTPIRSGELARQLGADEAMVSYLIGEKQSYLWVLRPDKLTFMTLPIGAQELDSRVARLRRQLDLSEGLKPFSLDQSHELFQRILAPAMSALTGTKHLLVVPDGALESLPFSVLVTQEPARDAQYRDAAWLARYSAITNLPAESALRALRRFARPPSGTQPFQGFGDPLLDGGGENRGPTMAAAFRKGPVADVRTVKSMARLPETAIEVEYLAKLLGAGPETVHLRADATETRIKAMDLSKVRVLAFSTHGLMAGDLDELSEPGLVLSPPATGSSEDDGVLTSSEIASLKLNADWVILSACNTAASDGTPGAEGLSGLAKAFFYAGSRSILVSYWPVGSVSSALLTTQMFAEWRKPGVTKAEALRRSMIALLRDSKNRTMAHPGNWAPFVVVGEGGR